jgi:hypothetical protein
MNREWLMKRKRSLPPFARDRRSPHKTGGVMQMPAECEAKYPDDGATTLIFRH